jgi:MoxR-like ATPase
MRSARQVGKSTAVRMAANAVGRKLVEINLKKVLRLNSVLETLDLKKIITATEAETHSHIEP